MQKTERGKHEGGDAAWEEQRLGSYKRSEVRLVDIQEGLCNDVIAGQDQCHALAETNEHLIEEWWFKEQDDAAGNKNSMKLTRLFGVSTFFYFHIAQTFSRGCASISYKSAVRRTNSVRIVTIARTATETESVKGTAQGKLLPAAGGSSFHFDIRL